MRPFASGYAPICSGANFIEKRAGRVIAAPDRHPPPEQNFSSTRAARDWQVGQRRPPYALAVTMDCVRRGPRRHRESRKHLPNPRPMHGPPRYPGSIRSKPHHPSRSSRRTSTRRPGPLDPGRGPRSRRPGRAGADLRRRPAADRGVVRRRLRHRRPLTRDPRRPDRPDRRHAEQGDTT